MNKLRTLKTKDKRANQRKKVPALIHYATPDKSFSGYVYNISEGGMFIGTKKPLAVGTDTTLAFTMPESGVGVPIKFKKVKGKVVWINKEGMGIRFKQVNELTKGKIRSILSE